MNPGKITILGGRSTGKSTLVGRFESPYGPGYGKTLGVRVARARVSSGRGKMVLLFWDIDGGVNPETRHVHYRGSSGFVIMADRTRPESLEEADRLFREIESSHPGRPSVLFMNKCDLPGIRKAGEAEAASGILPKSAIILWGSAQTGDGVAALVQHLAQAVGRI